MSERTKLILQIIGFSIIVIAIGFFIWWFFFKPVFVPSTPPTLPAPPTPPISGLPLALPAPPRPPVAPLAPFAAPPSSVASGGLTQTNALTPTAILAPFLGPDGTAVQYYNRTDGLFYRIRPDGTAEKLDDKVFFNVSKVTWAPDQAQTILEYPDGSNILYNFSTRRQTTLPRHWSEFSFAPHSDEIAFLSLGIEEGARWLAVANPDGSNTRPVEPLGTNADKVQVAWSPNDAIVAFSRTGSPLGLDEAEVFLIGKQGENFRSLLVNGLGFQGQWSPDGRTILYSTTSSQSNYKPLLWVVSGSPGTIGEQKQPLSLNTWANKCAFASTTSLYCAVPTNLPRGAGLYPAAVGNTPDNLYRVDLATGAASLVAVPTGAYTIDNLVISQDERYLYFTDKFSGQLYKIQLK